MAYVRMATVGKTLALLRALSLRIGSALVNSLAGLGVAEPARRLADDVSCFLSIVAEILRKIANRSKRRHEAAQAGRKKENATLNTPNPILS